MLQKRAEQQELQEELRRREEVVLRREACLQQKNKLEIKKLRSSQVSLRTSIKYDLLNLLLDVCISPAGIWKFIFLSLTCQALSRDLQRVSVQLETVEQHLQSGSNARLTGGVTKEELEKERDTLKKRRDALEAQLEENRVLSVEVREEETIRDDFKQKFTPVDLTGFGDLKLN